MSPCQIKGQGPSFGMKGDVGDMVYILFFFTFFLPFLLSDLETSTHSSYQSMLSTITRQKRKPYVFKTKPLQIDDESICYNYENAKSSCNQMQWPPENSQYSFLHNFLDGKSMQSKIYT